jgi:enoyl-CoA hydratase
MADILLQDRPGGGVLLLTLNRPAKRNALNMELVLALDDALDRAREDETVRCAVVTGDARAFSAGADIHDQHVHGAGVALSETRLAAWRRIGEFPKPIIAAVNGYALGGGAELMMMMDMAIAGRSARIGQPEINLGIFPGDGGTQRLPRLIGEKNALRMILSGEPISAAEAWRMGLVSEVVDDEATVPAALELARRIASHSPQAARQAKATIKAGLDLPLEQGLALEHRNIRPLFGTSGQLEGMAKFVSHKES